MGRVTIPTCLWASHAYWSGEESGEKGAYPARPALSTEQAQGHGARETSQARHPLGSENARTGLFLKHELRLEGGCQGALFRLQQSGGGVGGSGLLDESFFVHLFRQFSTAGSLCSGLGNLDIFTHCPSPL